MAKLGPTKIPVLVAHGPPNATIISGRITVEPYKDVFHAFQLMLTTRDGYPPDQLKITLQRDGVAKLHAATGKWMRKGK